MRPQRLQQKQLLRLKPRLHQALPDTLAAADHTLKEIDAIKNHPGKGLATGLIAGAMPAIGGPQADYIARLDQLKGAATQMAIQANKGGGMRLTNAEVMSLQKVAARLDRRADVDSALDDFASVIKGVRERAGVKAGQGPTPATRCASCWRMDSYEDPAKCPTIGNHFARRRTIPY